MQARADWLPQFARTTAFRLMAAFVAVFVTVAAIIAGALIWQTNDLLIRQVFATITAEADGLKSLDELQGPEAVTKVVADRSREAAANLYFLADAEGRKIAGNLSRWPPELKDSGGGLFRYSTETDAPAGERVAIGLPVTLGSGHRLLIGRDVEEQRAFLERVRNLSLAGFGLLVIIGIAGGLAASHLILRRIGVMTAAAQSIMAGDLSRRIASTGSGDELDELARNLNAMLDRIEQLMAGLREISDNIAHDLKTPLNRLRSRAEAVLRDARSAEDYREGLGRTIEAADDIIKTFNALLLIARLEAGAVDESMEDFDLTALVRDVVELYEPLAEENQRRLSYVAGGQIFVRANRQLVGQAVANLLDNAIKYGGPQHGEQATPESNEIAVTLTCAANSMVELVVGDHGPGIPAFDRYRALKRFVRLEASRTRPGTGLGLSLVAAVARLHNGAVRLEDNNPGLRVVLSWPAGEVRDAGRSERPGSAKRAAS